LPLTDHSRRYTPAWFLLCLAFFAVSVVRPVNPTY
jgi:hypothetical protein